MATIDAAICFFIPYYATTASGAHMATDVFSIGKTTFVALLGAPRAAPPGLARWAARPPALPS